MNPLYYNNIVIIHNDRYCPVRCQVVYFVSSVLTSLSSSMCTANIAVVVNDTQLKSGLHGDIFEVPSLLSILQQGTVVNFKSP